MQVGSYLSLVAATIGFFGAILTVFGVLRLAANRTAGLSAVPDRELSSEQLRKLAAQKTYLSSGLILIFSSILGFITRWVVGMGERRILDDHHKIAIYAAVALGTVISVFVYGFTAAFNERRIEK